MTLIAFAFVAAAVSVAVIWFQRIARRWFSEMLDGCAIETR